MRLAALPACTLAFVGAAAFASASAASLETVNVEAQALPGSSVDPRLLPGSVQTLDADELLRLGDFNPTQAMETRLASVSINDNLGNARQGDIGYRGFTASPVLGNSQGLALYQNGVRINEAFGDTSNWDLLPEVAIKRISVVSANPVYGLNALGGAIAVSLKNGFDFHGRELELSGGSFGQRAASAQWGMSSAHYGLYLAGAATDSEGWRRFSGDSLRQGYAAFTAQRGRGSLELGYTYADNRLAGQGSAPAAELAISRQLTFTGPQLNANRLDFLTLNGHWQASERWTLQSVLYYRDFRQQLANGNTTGYLACTTPTHQGALCQPDGLTPLTGADGQPLPDISQQGSQPIGQNDLESIAARSRGASLQVSGTASLSGLEHHYALGAAADFSRVDFQSRTQLGLINSQLLVQSTSLYADTPEGTDFSATPVSLLANNTYLGGYATDTLLFGGQAALTASARYQSASVELQDQRGTALSGRNRYAHFNPQLGLVLPLGDAMNLHVDVARSSRTPTASEIECSDPARPCLLPSQLAGDPPSLRQVVATSFEFGLRSRTDRRASSSAPLSWNLGLFRTELHDDIYGIATATGHGYYQNIGGTQRQGLEAGLALQRQHWSGFLNYSYLDATFRSNLTLPSTSNPFRDANDTIRVRSGAQLPGIARHRVKLGADLQLTPQWSIGATLLCSSSQYYFGDEANRAAPLPGYTVLGLHASLSLPHAIEAFAVINNLLDRRYATYGIYSDPTGVGAPGIPASAQPNDPGVDNRFYTPAAPLSARAGLRIRW
jgi:iron complex outermembrane receptor protein